MYLVQYSTIVRYVVLMSQRRTPKNQPPLAHTTTHNTKTQQKIEITLAMVPPSRRIPVAPILQVSAIAVRCVIDINLRNTAM
jgi:hypothetical protein